MADKRLDEAGETAMTMTSPTPSSPQPGRPDDAPAAPPQEHIPPAPTEEPPEPGRP